MPIRFRGLRDGPFGLVPGGPETVSLRKTCELPACSDVLKLRGEHRPASEFHFLEEPRLNWLGRYWSDLRGWADIPKRRHLDPLDIRHDVLPWIFLIERRDHGFRYRLSGSGHRAATGKELTGQAIEDTTDNPAFNAHLAQLFRTSATRRRPFYSKDRLICGPVARCVERLILPLSDTDNCATTLLVAQVEKAPVIDKAFATTSPAKLVRRYMFYQRAESFDTVTLRELYL